MDSSDFVNALKHAAEKSLLKMVTDGQWFKANYEHRVEIPSQWLREVYALVDFEALKRALAKRLTDELADRLINHIAAEIATDVKTILGDQFQREALRAMARRHIEDCTRLPVHGDENA